MQGGPAPCSDPHPIATGLTLDIRPMPKTALRYNPSVNFIFYYTDEGAHPPTWVAALTGQPSSILNFHDTFLY